AVRLEEYWRKLYVGMTRAEDELYVTGALTATAKIDGSWYEAIEMALRPFGQSVKDVAGAEVALVYPAERPAITPLSVKLPGTADGFRPLVLPPLPEFVAVPILSPSSEGENAPILQSASEKVRDAELARKSGLALHALLQHLTRIAKSDWDKVMPRAMEALLPDHADAHGPVMEKARRILERDDLAHLFGPNSRAEVAFLVKAERGGDAVQLSGRMDRLVVDDGGVLIVDYKSDAHVPERSEAVPARYLTQL